LGAVCDFSLWFGHFRIKLLRIIYAKLYREGIFMKLPLRTTFLALAVTGFVGSTALASNCMILQDDGQYCVSSQAPTSIISAPALSSDLEKKSKVQARFVKY
jgi:hypothetical protein